DLAVGRTERDARDLALVDVVDPEADESGLVGGEMDVPLHHVPRARADRRRGRRAQVGRARVLAGRPEDLGVVVAARGGEVRELQREAIAGAGAAVVELDPHPLGRAPTVTG